MKIDKLQRIETDNNIKLLKINKKINKSKISEDKLNNKIKKYTLIRYGLMFTGAVAAGFVPATIDDSLLLPLVLALTSMNLCFSSGVYAEKRTRLIEELSELKDNLEAIYKKEDKYIKKAIDIRNEKEHIILKK